MRKKSKSTQYKLPQPVLDVKQYYEKLHTHDGVSGIHKLTKVLIEDTSDLIKIWNILQKHSVFYHRYHIVWITKYRYKVLRGLIQQRVREIVRQICNELGVEIIRGVLSSDHVYVFVSIPPHVLVSEFTRKA